MTVGSRRAGPGSEDAPFRAVVFHIGDERFAVRADRVVEVLEEAVIQPVPGLPPHMAGVLRHRNRWLAVVDPADRLGVASGATGAVVLLLRRGSVVYGLTADRVAAARDLDPGRMRAVSGRAVRHGAEDDAGPVRVGGSVVVDGDGVITVFEPEDLFEAETPVVDKESIVERSEGIGSDDVSVVSFRLGEEEFGVPVERVEEVVPYGVLGAPGSAPSFVAGVLDLRGAAIPVVDLRERFGLEASVPVPETRFLVVSIGGERIGLMVDSVAEVVRLPADRVSAPPDYLRGLQMDYLDALGRVGDRLLILVRTDRLLTADELDGLRAADWAATADPGAEEGGPARP